MGRVKGVSDWLLTYSPEVDAKNLPPDLLEVINSQWGITRGVLVAEKEEKWHCHFIFSTSRAYNSDYKWYAKGIAHLDYGPELDIKYHDSFLGCAGGYMEKDSERIIVNCYGVSEKELDYGKELYKKRLRRKEVRKFIDDHIIINPSKIDVAIGAYKAKFDIGFGFSDEKALQMMAADGFAFAQARPGYSLDYAKLFKEKVNIEEVHEVQQYPAELQGYRFGNDKHGFMDEQLDIEDQFADKGPRKDT